MNQSIIRTIHPSNHPSIHPPIHRSITHSLTHSLTHSINQSIDRSIDQSINQSINRTKASNSASLRGNVFTVTTFTIANGPFPSFPSLILDTKVFSILKKCKDNFCTYLDYLSGRFRNPATVISIITVRIILSFLA